MLPGCDTLYGHPGANHYFDSSRTETLVRKLTYVAITGLVWFKAGSPKYVFGSSCYVIFLVVAGRSQEELPILGVIIAVRRNIVDTNKVPTARLRRMDAR